MEGQGQVQGQVQGQGQEQGEGEEKGQGECIGVAVGGDGKYIWKGMFSLTHIDDLT